MDLGSSLGPDFWTLLLFHQINIFFTCLLQKKWIQPGLRAPEHNSYLQETPNPVLDKPPTTDDICTTVRYHKPK